MTTSNKLPNLTELQSILEKYGVNHLTLVKNKICFEVPYGNSFSCEINETCIKVFKPVYNRELLVWSHTFLFNIYSLDELLKQISPITQAQEYEVDATSVEDFINRYYRGDRIENRKQRLYFIDRAKEEIKLKGYTTIYKFESTTGKRVNYIV